MTTSSLPPIEERFRGDRPLRTFAQIYRAGAGRLLLAGLCFVVKHSPAWLMPAIVANVVDAVARRGPGARHALVVNGIALAVLLAQNVPVNWLYARLLSRAARDAESELRAAICRRLQQLAIGYFVRHSPATLQAKILRDVEAVEAFTRLLFEIVLVAALNLVFTIVIVGMRQPWFLLYIAITAPIQVTLFHLLHAGLSTRDAALRDEVEGMSTRVLEMTHLLPVTRAHGLERAALARVGEAIGRVRAAGLRVDATNAAYGAVLWVIGEGFYMACLFAPAFAALAGWLPIGAGDVVLLASYFGLISGSFYHAVRTAPQLARGVQAIRSIAEVLECPDLERNEGKPALRGVRGELAFQDVGFTYPGAPAAALTGFSLSVAPGETVALVGPSGAGKSTVLHLAVGFVRPTGGRVLIDGHDLEAHDARTYRGYVSVVPQEALLFHGTVRDNVTYGLADVPDAAVETALRDANAWDFVSALPGGVHAVIGERGAKLSGGQKQRIAIARALIRDPRVLLLDEATSALDTESEALVQQALDRLRRGRTTLVVAHRLSTVRDAHRIVVLDGGRIVEVGAHEALLATGGLYARFQDRQAGARA